MSKLPAPLAHPALLLLAALCVLVCACQGTGPREASPALDPGAARPSSQLAARVVEHAPSRIAASLAWRHGALARAPMRLSAGDGTGLRLVSIEGTVVIDDPLVFTELHLRFDNPEARRREGRFEFELPAKAALSRLAMKIGHEWMEGEVVERAAGRETFESYIHERPKVDPALLETAGANRVAARVFPIQPHERKDIIVSYSQPLEGGLDELRVPLAGLPALEHLDLRVLVNDADTDGGEAKLVELHERDFEPSGDLVVELGGREDASAVVAGALAVIRVQAQTTGELDDFEALTILFDTSASTAARFDAEVDRLGEMLETLGEMPVRLLAFDQEVELIHAGPASSMFVGGDQAPLARLRARRAFGASDLHAALRSDALAAAGGARLLIWSDGVATAGELDHAALSEAADALEFDRVDAFASSASAERELLGALAATGRRAGFVVGPDLAGTELLGALGRAGFDGVDIEVAGAEWVYPSTLDGLAPGDDLVVYARFPLDEAEPRAGPRTIEVEFGDPRLAGHRVPVRSGRAPLIERAVARAEVAELQDRIAGNQDAIARPELVDSLVDKALRHRILTPYTALLVLENGAEYRRHGIDRKAQADILTAGREGVELLGRGGGPTRRHAIPFDDPATAAAEVSVPQDAFEATGMKRPPGWKSGLEAKLGLQGTGRGGGGLGEGLIGLGNTGWIGKGGGGGTGSGYGRGSGAQFGGRGKPVPRVRLLAPIVEPALDDQVVRRIARRHLNELRAVYQRGLGRNPRLGGRVVLELSVVADGRVSTASLSGSLGDAEVERMLIAVARRWRFPAPQGGVTAVARLPVEFGDGHGSRSSAQRWSQRPTPQPRQRRRRPGDPSDPYGARWMGSALNGRYETVTKLLRDGALADAEAEAWDWAAHEPDNSLALIALASALIHRQQPARAARVLGSLIDLHPERADMRRAAGARLEAVGPEAYALAEDSYRKALAQRPDQINGHRLLAWLLVKQGQYADAYALLAQALEVEVPRGRFNGVKTLLRDDLELIAAAWLHAEPGARAIVERDGVEPATQPSLRVVANWETDASDVDILVEPIGASARVGARHADVRSGYGPEAWISRGPARAEAVSARVRYFSRGAMGYALGSVAAISHDGGGALRFEARPFVLMDARGSIDLGRFEP